MTIRRSVVLVGVVICFISSLASADTIPITGVGWAGAPVSQGGCCYNGDFEIGGPGLSLFQGTPDGPNSIGGCVVGTVCNFSYTIVSAATFCSYCLNFSEGSLGTKTADFLGPASGPMLTFTGSAFYSGGTSMVVPMTVTGTIIGYKLVTCDSSGRCSPCGGVGCSLGPVVFNLKLVGHGEGTVTLYPDGSIAGTSTNFSGTATVVPEPISLVLTGTGLAGVWLRKRTTQTKQLRA